MKKAEQKAMGYARPKTDVIDDVTQRWLGTVFEWDTGEEEIYIPKASSMHTQPIMRTEPSKMVSSNLVHNGVK